MLEVTNNSMPLSYLSPFLIKLYLLLSAVSGSQILDYNTNNKQFSSSVLQSIASLSILWFANP